MEGVSVILQPFDGQHVTNTSVRSGSGERAAAAQTSAVMEEKWDEKVESGPGDSSGKVEMEQKDVPGADLSL